jgi:hypothetical protein
MMYGHGELHSGPIDCSVAVALLPACAVTAVVGHVKPLTA